MPPKKKQATKQAPSNTNAGTGVVLLIAAGLAGLWLWRRHADSKGGAAGAQQGSAQGKTAAAAGAGPRGKPAGNNKKNRSRRKEKRDQREDKRQAHLDKVDRHADAPEEDAVVRDEAKGIMGDHLYLNYNHFTGSKKK